MKIRTTTDSGSALLIALVLTAVIGTALASYLKLAEVQNRSVVHSQYWNGAIPLAEAGIEEALAHLNKVGDGNRGTNGWAYTNGAFHMKRTMESGKYQVTIDTNAQPFVTSSGYVVDPVSGKEVERTVKVLTSKAGSLMRGIIARDNITMNGGGVRIDSFDSADTNYSTNGRFDVAKSKDGGFAGAVTGNINTGNGGVWGYVATGPNGNVAGNVGNNNWMATSSGVQPGHYRKDLNVSFPPVAPPFTSGAMNPAINTNITITNLTYLTNQITSTTYPNPVPLGGVNTSVGTVTTPNKPTIWTGPMSTNTAPFTSTTYPSAGTYLGNVATRNVVEGKGKNAKTVTYYDYNKISGYTYQTTTYSYNNVTTNTSTTTDNYTYATGKGNYVMTSISMSGHAKFLVYGDTTLYVPGGVSLSGQAQIIIMPGASLKLYVGGAVNLHGNGVMNGNTSALGFQTYGLPSCTSIDFGGNASFTGVVYAPNAHVQMGGGGSNTYDTVGAITCKSVGMNGHFNFHYDEMLGRQTGPDLFKVASWNEI